MIDGLQHSLNYSCHLLTNVRFPNQFGVWSWFLWLHYLVTSLLQCHRKLLVNSTNSWQQTDLQMKPDRNQVLISNWLCYMKQIINPLCKIWWKNFLSIYNLHFNTWMQTLNSVHFGITRDGTRDQSILLLFSPIFLSPLEQFGLAMSLRSSSHRHKHAWMA